MIEIWPRYVEKLTQEWSLFSWCWGGVEVSERTKVLDVFEIHKSFQTAETEWLRRQQGMLGGGSGGSQTEVALDATFWSLDFILWEKFQVGGTSLPDLFFRITLRRRDSGVLEWR